MGLSYRIYLLNQDDGLYRLPSARSTLSDFPPLTLTLSPRAGRGNRA